MNRVIMLDIDGTLYPQEIEKEIIKELQKRRVEFLVKKLGINKKIARLVIRRLEEEDKPFDDWVEELGIPRKEYYNEVWGKINPKKYLEGYEVNVRGVIQQLEKGGYSIVIVTNAPLVWAEKILKVLKLKGRIERIYTCDDGIQKPSIEAFKKVLDDYNIDADKLSKRTTRHFVEVSPYAIMVGNDVEKDIFSAQNLGITGIYIDWEAKSPIVINAIAIFGYFYPRESSNWKVPYVTINSIEQLPDAIEYVNKLKW